MKILPTQFLTHSIEWCISIAINIETIKVLIPFTLNTKLTKFFINKKGVGFGFQNLKIDEYDFSVTIDEQISRFSPVHQAYNVSLVFVVYVRPVKTIHVFMFLLLANMGFLGLRRGAKWS